MPETSTTSVLPAGFTQETFDAFLEARREPDWLRERRRKAWERYAAMPMPAANHEEWRRTDIRALKLREFAPPPAAAETAEASATAAFETLFERGEGFAGHAAHVDGRGAPPELDEKWRAKGVILANLDEAAAEHRDLVEPHLLTRAVDPAYDKFAALHAAFWTGGTFLYVPRGVVIDEPLHALVGLAAGGGAELSHTLLVLEDGAEAAFFEETASADAESPGLHVGAIELWLKRGARLRYVGLQNWNQHTWHFGHQRALVAQHASLQWTVGALGSRLAKVNQEVVLEGQGAGAQVNGVMFTSGRQHLSYHTRQVHQAERTQSDLLYKGVLKDHSRIVWRGMIYVAPGAQKTDAYQRNDDLVLSGDARADSIPGLEIQADDVRCTHGATAGRVDDEQVFYAMSRGLSRYEAIHMIVEGFFHGVYDRVPDQVVRDSLRKAVEAKLGIGAVI